MDNLILPICSQCSRPYPEKGAPYLCHCGGVFDFPAFQLPGEPNNMAIGQGLWKFRPYFSFGESLPEISLGEGNTPLCEMDYQSHKIFAKLEFLNPTGSYKDRGSAVLTSFLVSRGITDAVEDSSGNAGASFAAYSARAGIRAEIYIPESASGPKRNQIEAYGAKIHRIPGPRLEASRAVLEAVKHGQIYASHAYMPFGLHGIATIAYEIFEQLGRNAPGTIIAPVGHGGLLYGLMKGFEALKTSSNAQEEPFYLGVQSQGCSPVFDAFRNGEFTLREPILSDTIAEGVKVSAPVRGSAILRNLSGHRGKIISVSDDQLLRAYQEIARKGFFIEPTSSLVWAALENNINDLPAPVVLVLTGSGLKTQI